MIENNEHWSKVKAVVEEVNSLKRELTDEQLARATALYEDFAGIFRRAGDLMKAEKFRREANKLFARPSLFD